MVLPISIVAFIAHTMTNATNRRAEIALAAILLYYVKGYSVREIACTVGSTSYGHFGHAHQCAPGSHSASISIRYYSLSRTAV
ncbi:MAG: hypothetical protein IKR50_03195 [Prevotella sp.]|nr:hypothetical protein [Prevotella sp.]